MITIVLTDANEPDPAVFGVQLAQIAMAEIRRVALDQKKAGRGHKRVRRITDRAVRAIEVGALVRRHAGMLPDQAKAWEREAVKSFNATFATSSRFLQGREGR